MLSTARSSQEYVDTCTDGDRKIQSMIRGDGGAHVDPFDPPLAALRGASEVRKQNAWSRSLKSPTRRTGTPVVLRVFTRAAWFSSAVCRYADASPLLFAGLWVSITQTVAPVTLLRSLR